MSLTTQLHDHYGRTAGGEIEKLCDLVALMQTRRIVNPDTHLGVMLQGRINRATTNLPSDVTAMLRRKLERLENERLGDEPMQ